MAPVVTKTPAPRIAPTPIAVSWTGPSARRKRSSPSWRASASSVCNGLRANRRFGMGAFGGSERSAGRLARECERREKKDVAERGRARRRLSGRQRQHAHRAAAAADELERSGDDDRAGRRQQVEGAQARAPEAAGAVHQGVARERRVETECLA